MRKARAVENTESPARAASEAGEGARVHGRSMSTLSGIRIAAPQSIDPAAGTIGARPVKVRPKIAAPA